MLNALHLAGNGDIWIGARSGLVRFRPDAPRTERFRLYPPTETFPIRDVPALGEDAEHNLWLGAGTLGVVRIASGPFQLFTDARPVQGMVESRSGDLYAVIGIIGSLTLNQFRGNRFEPIRLPLPMPATTMGWGQGQIALQNRAGEWWTVSDAGVVRYPAADDPCRLAGRPARRIYGEKDGLPYLAALSIFEDSRGDIWAGPPTEWTLRPNSVAWRSSSVRCTSQPASGCSTNTGWRAQARIGANRRRITRCFSPAWHQAATVSRCAASTKLERRTRRKRRSNSECCRRSGSASGSCCC